MWKRYRVFITIIIIAIALVYFNPGPISVPVEKTEIPSGIGIDLIESNTGETQYMLSSTSYTFNEKEKINSMIIWGTGTTISDTRTARQLQSNHKFIAALEKVIIMSEDVSQSGINDILDILFANQFMNDMGWIVVCKGKALDTIKYKVSDYPSSSDYINGMIENLKEYHFFSENYKIMDTYVRVDAEGRNLVLPYIEISDGEFQVAGMVLFKKDKEVKKIDTYETRVMNMLREDKARGMLELKKDSKEYTAIYGDSKRKVSCQKSGSKYTFTIDLSFKGDIVSNTLIKDLEKKPKVIKEYEHDIEQQTQKMCQEFIDKMQNDYKLDCLELGRVACAKYGRNTGVDWNEIVCDSDIKVNVKVKVAGFGRGRYTEMK